MSFERVTLTVTFDLHLNIGHNFLTVRDLAFIFGIMCSLYPYLSNGTVVERIIPHSRMSPISFAM